MIRRHPIRLLPTLALLWLAGGCATQPAGLSGNQLDVVVMRAMQEFGVPGAAVGVIKDGVVLHAAGYGVRELGRPEPVDTQTLFRVASTTKAMTASSLAILVDEGRLGWDDKVVDHLSGFRMHDPWITREFTVTDLLTHRSGLGAYAGDLMLWPKPNSFTRADIIDSLRYFQAASGFRARYAYDNQLYIVAGEIVPAVTGVEWEDFVDQRIFAALGTKRCFAGRIPGPEFANLAAPHVAVEGRLEVVDRNRIDQETSVAAAAGGVRCSLDDMLRWVRLQLARGQLPDGSRVYSEQQARMMWSPQTILGVADEAYMRDQTHFRAYALGWRLADVNGYLHVSHTGSFTGWNAYVVLIPELDLGAVVLINASAEGARQSIMQGIIKPWLGVDDVDWVTYYASSDGDDDEAETEPEVDWRGGSVLASLAAYAGRYRDPWFGDVLVTEEDGALHFAAVKSPKMAGRLWPYEGHTFIARFTDRTLDADAWVEFSHDEAGEATGMELRAIYSSTDGSFNYGDLDLVRVREP